MSKRVFIAFLLVALLMSAANGVFRRVPLEYPAIQAAIDSSVDGDEVLVEPNVYTEQISFLGKAITVRGDGGAATIDGDGDFAVSFYESEGPGSVLQNFIITNSYMAVFAAATSPTIRNVTVVNNRYGAAAYAVAAPDIRSSIFWNNSEDDLLQCAAQYSCIQDGSEGQGNIAADPLCADANAGDYRLLSRRGRYSPLHGLWVIDDVTSPCISTGDPMGDFSAERLPNGGRIDMGAYGGTPQASLSEWQIDGDMDCDGAVDFNDFSIFAGNWTATSVRARETSNRRICAAHLRSLGRTMMLYSNDNKEEYPTSDKWCDLLVQYWVGVNEAFRCPGAEVGPSNYAKNPNATGSYVDPNMVLLFETTAGWNQFGGPEILTTENHRGDGCNIVFSDCHVEFVPKERLGQLKW